MGHKLQSRCALGHWVFGLSFGSIGGARSSGEPRAQHDGGAVETRGDHRPYRERPGGLHAATVTSPWADAIETHTAVVFFAGDRAYKIKKPVRLDFVDLSTRIARQDACQAEVTLNRRLAPDVYLGVADISMGGQPVEHAVVMRRLPAEASLTARLRADDVALPGQVDAIAGLLAEFHRLCPIVGAGLSRELFTPPIQLFRTEIERMARLAPTEGGQVLPRALHLAETYASGRRALFQQRLAAGLFREVHGDLLADDIYLLPDGPRVLDCLEFDQRLRIGDVLHDIAFLAMDLERLGRPDLAARLITSYADAADQPHPATLAHFYIAHRALIRAKVATIRQQQRRAPDSGVAVLLAECLRHLEAAQVKLVVLGGLPGVGKTTLADLLAERLGAVHLSSDRMRYELAGPSPTVASFGTGRYAPEVTDRVYTELLGRARDRLSMGEHVVLDASWRSGAHRDAVRDLARDAGALLVELHATADDAIADARLRNRGHEPGGSEATVEIREQMRVRFDPWPGAVALDTGEPLAEVARAAQDAIDSRSTCSTSVHCAASLPALEDLAATR